MIKNVCENVCNIPVYIVPIIIPILDASLNWKLLQYWGVMIWVIMNVVLQFSLITSVEGHRIVETDICWTDGSLIFYLTILFFCFLDYK